MTVGDIFLLMKNDDPKLLTLIEDDNGWLHRGRMENVDLLEILDYDIKSMTVGVLDGEEYISECLYMWVQPPIK